MRPWQLPEPVKWQHEFLKVWDAHPDDDFLLVAWPGAGKTIAALRAARDSVLEGDIEQVIIATPTDPLRTQWGEVGGQAGLHVVTEFDPTWRLPKDAHGLVVTYQQIASNPEVYRALAGHRRTGVILDEPHHLGEKLSWGDASRRAFEPARWRLLLTGTPFRTDGSPIPFVRYVDGRARQDFTYGFQRAMQENRCRPVDFPSYEGHIAWLIDGEEHTATFTDEISQIKDRHRVRTALDPASGWLTPVLRDAHNTLRGIRDTEHPEAAGLVITSNIRHAEDIAQALTAISGEAVELVTSDDPGARTRLRRFAQERTPWIVSIRMITEGVDIPRLRVLVWATVVRTELAFIQAVGRVLRVQPDLGEQTALVYIPKDQYLASYAARIEQEVAAYLTEPEREHEDDGGPRPPREDRTLTLVESLPSIAYRDVTISSGTRVSPEALRRAEEFARERAPGYRLDPRALALLAQALPAERAAAGEPEPVVSLPTYAEDLKRLKKLAHMQATTYARQYGKDFKFVNTELKRETGAWLPESTLEQVQQRLRILAAWKRDR